MACSPSPGCRCSPGIKRRVGQGGRDDPQHLGEARLGDAAEGMPGIGREGKRVTLAERDRLLRHGDFQLAGRARTRTPRRPAAASPPLPPPGSMSDRIACTRFSPDGVSRYSVILRPPKLIRGRVARRTTSPFGAWNSDPTETPSASQSRISEATETLARSRSSLDTNPLVSRLLGHLGHAHPGGQPRRPQLGADARAVRDRLRLAAGHGPSLRRRAPVRRPLGNPPVVHERSHS